LKENHDLPKYVLLVPQAQGYWWEEEIEQVFSNLLQKILKDFSLDTNRIYIAGVSNGGMGGFFYSTHHPYRFAAMASLMGFPVIKHRPPQSKEDAKVLKNLRNTAVYLVHGEKDDKVDPGGDRMAYQMLSRLNFTIEYKELPGRGHDIGFNEFEPELIGWFQSHQRNSRPQEVELIMNYPKYNRSYWIQVNKTKKLPAEVFGEIKGNTVEIKTSRVLNLTVFLDEELVDFTKEVIIRINKKLVYKGKISSDADMLLKSARENRDAQLSHSVSLDFALDSSR